MYHFGGKFYNCFIVKMDKPVLVVGGVICAVANCDITDDGGTAKNTLLPASNYNYMQQVLF